MAELTPKLQCPPIITKSQIVAAGADGCVGKAVKGGTTAILSTISQLWYQRFGNEAVAAHETRPIMPSPPSSSAPSFKSSGSPSFKRERVV